MSKARKLYAAQLEAERKVGMKDEQTIRKLLVEFDALEATKGNATLRAHINDRSGDFCNCIRRRSLLCVCGLTNSTSLTDRAELNRV
jgi:hypothetical protein